jgi:uncharacterized membrane protein YbhN (UPF0104 family)
VIVKHIVSALRPSIAIALLYAVSSIGFALTSANAGLFTAHVRVSPLVLTFGLAALLCRLLLLFVALPLAVYRLSHPSRMREGAVED